MRSGNRCTVHGEAGTIEKVMRRSKVSKRSGETAVPEVGNGDYLKKVPGSHNAFLSY